MKSASRLTSMNKLHTVQQVLRLVLVGSKRVPLVIAGLIFKACTVVLVCSESIPLVLTHFLGPH